MATIPRRVAILGGARIPFARANTAYVDQGNLEMMSAAMKALVDRFSLKGQKIGEVSAGAVIKHSRDWNLARESTQSAGLDPHTPAYDVQRACGTSLTTVATLAGRIALGEIDSAIAGGSDSASDIPISYGRNLQRIVLRGARGRSLGERIAPWLQLRPKDLKPSVPGVAEMRTGLSMGEHCELMAREWGIGRAEQDELALASHRKAAEAWRGGFYSELVSAFRNLKTDNNIRADASIEKLASLKPAFDRSGSGTLTAGNSTPLTDGAACVLLGSEEWARSRGIPIQAYLAYTAFGRDQPREDEPEGRQRRGRPSVRRHRRAHRRRAREAARRPRLGPGADLDLHSRRDGGRSHPRALKQGQTTFFTRSTPPFGSLRVRRRKSRVSVQYST